MNKTEAAEILANETIVRGREWNMPIDKLLVESVMSEARHWRGLFPATVAPGTRPSWKTVLRMAKAQAEK